MTKEFGFYISNDYRSGPSIHTYSEKKKTPELGGNINFEVPKQGYDRLYIVNEYPQYQPVWHKDIKKDGNYKNIYLKIFSQIHDSMPFKVTGVNCAYKEEGHYPDVPKEIKETPNVLNEKELEDIEDNYDGLYFFFVINSDGEEVSTNLLIPIC